MTELSASLVVVAAGSGERLRASLERRGQSCPARKAFLPLLGRPMIAWTLENLSATPGLGEIIVALHEQDFANSELEEQLRGWGATGFVVGGARRQDSVLAGLRATKPEPGRIVGVHDGARPLIDADDVARTIAAAKRHGAAVLASPARDTIKRVDPRGRIIETPARSQLRLAQTPQCATRAVLLEALASASSVTDEAMALESAGVAVHVVEAQQPNFKITTADDIDLAEHILRRRGAAARQRLGPRVGEGWDIHRLVEGRALWLGGLEIPYKAGALGHSDGDVVLHALVDALLGAAGLGDIGELFPDTDPAHAGAASAKFVAEAVRRVVAAGFRVANADITIHAERPKLAPFKAQMRASVAKLLGLSPEARVNIKAKTNEGLDAVGRREAIAARAVVLLVDEEDERRSAL